MVEPSEVRIHPSVLGHAQFWMNMKIFLVHLSLTSDPCMLEQVKAVVLEKKEEHVLDSSLECCSLDEVNNVFSIATMCLESEPSKRPTMAEVLKMLEQIKSDKLVKES